MGVCEGRVLVVALCRAFVFCQEVYERWNRGATVGFGGFNYFWEVLYSRVLIYCVWNEEECARRFHSSRNRVIKAPWYHSVFRSRLVVIRGRGFWDKMSAHGSQFL